MRRYSKFPHLWSQSNRLARWLEPSGSDTKIESRFTLPHMHKLRHRLSEETVAALVQDYRDGASLAELQRRYSLGRGSVQQLLREGGERRRRKSLSETKVAALAKRYEVGLTIREIAAEQGLPKTTVQDALEREGVTMRPAARRATRRKD
jgi:DNA-directed RNA polymerase specialized sigma24 family protein